MYTVLYALRTIICTGVAFVVWFVVAGFTGPQEGYLGALLPVWLGGLSGGAAASVFNPRQGIMLGFTCSVLLCIAFLYYRFSYLGLGLGGNTLISLWPIWWIPSVYLGAYGTILLMAARR